jgi:hypothetical protein
MEHSQNLSDPLILTVALVCAVVIIGLTIAFRINKDVQFKKRLLAMSYAFAAVALLVLMALFRVQTTVIAIAIPAVVFVLFLQFKMTKFCDKCGRTVIQRTPFDRFEHCPKCGAKYEE